MIMFLWLVHKLLCRLGDHVTYQSRTDPEQCVWCWRPT